MRVELEVLAPNVTKVFLDTKTILFSYSLPIALTVRKDGEVRRYHTSESPTRTTSKHLNAYTDRGDYERVTQKELESLIAAE